MITQGDGWLSAAHHHEPQYIKPGDWRTVKVDGQSAWRPPFTGRAVIGVQLLGRMSPTLPDDAVFRILRTAPFDDTGWHSLVIRRHWSLTYAWTGYVDAAREYVPQIMTTGGAPIVVVNAAIKLDLVNRWSDGTVR